MYCTLLLPRLIVVTVLYEIINIHSVSTKLSKTTRRMNMEWSSWSQCSRSCGSGVMQRKRTCHHKRPKCISTQTKICNTQMCPGRSLSLLQIQCSKFDGTVMAGVPYRWVPFYSGRDECSLQCRAVGHKFYAKLSPRVENGTPCGFNKSTRHVCNEGRCVEVGCDGLVGSSAREDACGVCGGSNSTCRLISGLFTNPSLNPGYNFVAQIPANASFIRVSHLDKHSTNKIALRTLDGKFILNGLNTSSSFGEIGSKISYENGFSSNGESVAVRGPLVQPVDLMVIYQEPNKGIKYEYRIPAIPPINEDHRNLLTFDISYPKMSDGNKSSIDRSLQFARHGKLSYSIGGRDRQMIIDDDPSKNRVTRTRKRKFRWKITGYSECSKGCGGGVEKPIVVCIRDINEVVVPDKRCSYESPPSQHKVCNSYPCPPSWVTGPWSSCSVKCGEGIETRDVSCQQETSSQAIVVSSDKCRYPQPSPKRICRQMDCLDDSDQWTVTEWSQCSVDCGTGIQTRSVSCKNGNCPIVERPTLSRECDMGSCKHWPTNSHWLHTEWTHKCSEDCGKGIQLRRVVCYGSHCNMTKKPADRRSCSTDIGCEPKWFAGPWQKCTGSCGVGERARSVICVTKTDQEFRVLNEDRCSASTKPVTVEPCLLPDCKPEWHMGSWSECPKSCDSSYQTRHVICLNKNLQPSLECDESKKPNTYHTCDTEACMQNDDCVDELRNCATVVQARLCLYNYYKNFCCRSCRRRNLK